MRLLRFPGGVRLLLDSFSSLKPRSTIVTHRQHITSTTIGTLEVIERSAGLAMDLLRKSVFSCSSIA